MTILVGTFAVPVRDARASWSPNGLPVATNGVNYQPNIIADGALGSIIAWYGGTGTDIFAQRIAPDGSVAPGWPTNGPLAVCAAGGLQSHPVLVSDLAGGALIFWQDARNGSNYDIYAQHITGAGTLADGWPADGLPVTGAPNSQYAPAVAPDDAGGAIVTWYDARHGVANYDIYAQHVAPTGDLLWPGGSLVCAAVNLQVDPAIVADGFGGAFIAWEDYRKGSESDIYVQHLRADGTPVPGQGWPADGLGACLARNSQFTPVLARDGANGVYVAWQDFRDGTEYDIYAQHLSSAGAIVSGWPPEGRPVCQAPNSQFYPVIAGDGLGGVFVAWQDYRSGTSNDIYVQHLTAGNVSWSGDGVPVSTAANAQVSPHVASDGWGGAFIAWEDNRSGSTDDIYLQQVTIQGTMNPNWDRDGLGVCLAPGHQSFPAMASSALGTVIITWVDGRSGSAAIYADQAVGTPPDVQPPGSVSDLHAEMLVNAAYLYWTAPGDDGTNGTAASYLIKYSTSPINSSNFAGIPGVVAAPAPLVAGTLQSACVDQLNPSTTYYFALQATDESGNISGLSNVYAAATMAPTHTGGPWNVCDMGNGLSQLPGGDLGSRVEQMSVIDFQNPSHEAVRIRLAAPASFSREALDLGIFDVAGRRLRTLRVESADSGHFDATWDRKTDSGSTVPIGVYFLRLSLGGQFLTRVIQLR